MIAARCVSSVCAFLCARERESLFLYFAQSTFKRGREDSSKPDRTPLRIKCTLWGTQAQVKLSIQFALAGRMERHVTFLRNGSKCFREDDMDKLHQASTTTTPCLSLPFSLMRGPWLEAFLTPMYVDVRSPSTTSGRPRVFDLPVLSLLASLARKSSSSDPRD